MVAGCACVLEDVIQDYDWDGNLWLSCWVAVFVCFHLLGHGCMVVGGAWSVEGVG